MIPFTFIKRIVLGRNFKREITDTILKEIEERSRALKYD